MKHQPMKNLLILVCFFFSGFLYAQDAPLQVVHLKNGSIFKGYILEDAPAGKIKIELPDGQIVEVSESEVVKVTEKEKERVKKKRPENAFLIDKGVFHFTSFGFSGATQEFGGLSFNVNIHQELGFQFGPKLGLGIGSGWEVFSPERGEMIIPVFANLHYYPSGGKSGFNMSLAGGYGFGLTNNRTGVFEAKGGYLAYGALGYLWPSSDKIKILADLGFRLQKAEFTETATPIGGSTLERDLLFRRITFRVGLLFH